MKYAYFNQNVPDADDAALAWAIQLAYVPVGCLLGGAIVQLAVTNLTDPCRSCSGPRGRCGGRPQATDVELQAERDAGRLRDLFGTDEDRAAMGKMKKGQAK